MLVTSFGILHLLDVQVQLHGHHGPPIGLIACIPVSREEQTSMCRRQGGETEELRLLQWLSQTAHLSSLLCLRAPLCVGA